MTREESGTNDSRIGASSTLGATLLCAFLAIAGFPATLWFQQQSPPIAMSWMVIVGAWILAILVLVAVAGLASRVIVGIVWAASRLSGSFAAALAFGLVVRVVTAFVVRPVPKSDGATYLQLAERLFSGAPYQAAGTFAFWPPGLPFLLSLLMRAGLASFSLLLVYGLFSFVLGAFGIRKLGTALGLRRYAALPVWLLAGWPSLVLCSGLPEKEPLVLALLTWAVYFCVEAFRGRSLAAVACGVTLGLAVLTQPATQLLVAVPFCAALLLPGRRRIHLGRSILILAAMLLTVAPWIYRNHQVLDGPFVLATNGGDNLYRANNDLATGAYTRVGTVDLDSLPEVESNRVGRVLATEWIVGHPARFVQLTAGRSLLFAGDDSYGAFAALKRGQAIPLGGPVYAVAKLLCAVPLLVLWCAMAALVIHQRKALADIWVALCISLVPFLYLTCIHAVFESGGRYHIPVLGFLFVALALGIERVAPSWNGSSMHRPATVR